MAIIKPTLNLVASEYTPEILNVTRASGATRVNAAGLVERVGSGTLRYDYDPTTLAGKGWLIEEARTNIYIQSEDYTGHSGTIVRTANTDKAPDGNTTADTMTWPVADAAGVNQTNAGAAANSETWTISAFVKKDSGNDTNWFDIAAHFQGGTSVYFRIRASLDDGDFVTSGSASGITGGVVEYADYWRVYVTGTNNATGNTQLWTSITTLTETGNAVTGALVIWGMQLEKGAFASSYIPTTTAAVTRAVDSATVALSDFDFSEKAYTVYAHVISPPESTTGSHFFCNVYKSVGDYHMFGFNAGNLINFVNVASVNTVYPTLVTGFAVNTEYRVSASFTTNDWAGVVDGGTVLTDTSTPMSTAPVTFNLGDYYGGHTANIHIKHMAIFNTNMSDADIQTITTG